MAPRLASPNSLQISDLSTDANSARRPFDIGNGTLQSIQGDIYFASVAYIVPGGTVFDDHLDVARDVRLGGFTSDTQDFWTGLAPARFYVNSAMTTPLTILGSPGSHYQVNQAPQDLALMAGAGYDGQTPWITTQSSANLPYGMSIYGAQQVTLSSPQNARRRTGQIASRVPQPGSPERNRGVDCRFHRVRQRFVPRQSRRRTGGSLVGESILQEESSVTYQADTTNLTVYGLNQDWGVASPILSTPCVGRGRSFDHDQSRAIARSKSAAPPSH